MRVLVVDDSVVFRSQLKNCLDGHEGIEVVGSAANGKIALDKLEQTKCDLVTLDMEMPDMDGMAFLAEKKRRGLPQKVIVFAAPTKQGGAQVLEALAAGASDFVAKPGQVSSLEEALEGIRRELLPKVMQFKRRHDAGSAATPSASLSPTAQPLGASPSSSFAKVTLETFRPHVVVIASSTGGPTALDQLLALLKGHQVMAPILLAQHMPPNFTEALARRLEVISGIPAAEGVSGEAILPGRIYVAPGDFHMSIVRAVGDGAGTIIRLDQGPKRNSVRPAADILFESAARYYGAFAVGIVLTGMGEDGRDGAVAIKQAGGGVMIQDRESSVVWGMPGAVHQVGAFDAQGDLHACGKMLQQMVCKR